MANVTIFCFLASYLVALAIELSQLWKPTALRRLIVLLFVAAGLLAHTFYLWNRSGQAELPPLLSSTRDWTLVLAWLVVGFYLYLVTVDRTLSIGVFLLPLVLGLVVASYFVEARANSKEALDRSWTMLHAASLALGTAAVLGGIALSLMYLMQHRRLRQKQGSGGLRLPSLERLARMNWWSVMVSVPLLTIGMATGLVLLLLKSGGSQLPLSDPVVIVNGLSWLGLSGVFVWMLLTPRATGRQVAWRTLLACGFLLLTMVGLTVMTRGGHAAAPTAAVMPASTVAQAGEARS